MAGYDHKKYWSKAKIRHRGWTEGQIKRLLPEPLSIACDGATLKLWEQSTVQRAEQSPEFQRSRGAGAGEGAGAPDRAAQLAKAAWDRAGKEESTVWRLAGHYHRGILGMMARIESHMTEGLNICSISYLFLIFPALPVSPMLPECNLLRST